ncbi:centromere protein H (CENP-H)-domain-containing protein [Microdochium bolleyi]|uniref:Centromere protein H (CENP-H)-domain-containing protein n=1 Tax=Microdochium bolleyi TaxID=196109 RepID=A0A136J3V4_9PEZI|nr:centromere protein H (CENP-H)-domain-containing protein [Microdochium bolleyi]
MDSNNRVLPPLSDDERRVLELHAQLRSLEQELALTQALHDYEPSSSSTRYSTQQDIEAAQADLADSRARYVLRNQVADSVLSVNPILQAVHHGVNASPIERDLEPLIADRDTASTAFAQQATSLGAILGSLAAVEVQSRTVAAENAALAAQLLTLAAEADQRRSQPVTDPAQAAEIAELEARVKASRQRFRVAKGTASAIVAGSGVDWARDAELRGIVLDAEDD